MFHIIGKGGFADVYLAKCKKTACHVAIKMVCGRNTAGIVIITIFILCLNSFQMDRKLIKQKNILEKVREEVVIHKRLLNPSIIRLYTSFEDSNYLYLVLELCNGCTLEKYVQHFPNGLPVEKGEYVFVKKNLKNTT